MLRIANAKEQPLQVLSQNGQAALLDAVIARMGLKNDLALARAANMFAPAISKLRTGPPEGVAIGAVALLRFHEISGISIQELKSYLLGEEPQHTPVQVPKKHPEEIEHLAKETAARLAQERYMLQVLRLARLARNNDFAGMTTSEKLLAALVLNRFDWITELGSTICDAMEAVSADHLPCIPLAAKMMREDELAKLLAGS